MKRNEGEKGLVGRFSNTKYACGEIMKIYQLVSQFQKASLKLSSTGTKGVWIFKQSKQ